MKPLLNLTQIQKKFNQKSEIEDILSYYLRRSEEN